jgi:hypothetical protein
MPIYLTHPDHGTHICYSQMEVEECKKHGWKLKEEPPPERKKPGPKPKGKS